ncbi:MAG: hypothetical protein V2B19_11425 [Pseudomonadota bacterium]
MAGDYLSAATFLGLAGLTFALGYDGIFYTFCFSVGLTLLALFVAGPLRKFGRFTVPVFLAKRFHSRSARLFAVIVVLAISGFYAAPQILGGAQILHSKFSIEPIASENPKACGYGLFPARSIPQRSSGRIRSKKVKTL